MPLSDFFLCYYETTRKCDQGCPNCMTKLVAPPTRSELSTDEAKHLVLDELRAICPNGAVSFSGGEILQRPDHLELIEHNARNGLYTFVNTSGSGLDSDKLKQLKRAAAGRLTMGFSLDSVDFDVQKKCRAGDRRNLERLLSICTEHQVTYFVLVTVSRQNLKTLKTTMDWLYANKVAVIRSPFVPRGAATKARELCFDRRDMETLIQPALRDNPLSYVSYAPFFAAPDATRLSVGGCGISLGNLGCQAGRTFMGINAEGDVAPCVHLLDSSVCCGNVREQSLSRMFTESGIMRTLRGERPAKGKCARCRYGDSCRGCRALAYYHSGDYLAEDPTCFFEPENRDTRSPYEDLQTAHTRTFMSYLVQNPPWSDIFGTAGWVGVALLNFKDRLSAVLGNRRR